MIFFLFGKVVETQKLSSFSLGLLPVFSNSFLCYFLSLLLLSMAAILLESKQFVVGCKVCGVSGPVIMAASESTESHRAAGELLLLSPFPL